MKLLVDMNLSPQWVEFLQGHGFDTIHWSTVGNPRASDKTIIEWAREDTRVVLTHDLDFSRVLALTRASGPASSRSGPRMSFRRQSESLSYAPWSNTPPSSKPARSR